MDGKGYYIFCNCIYQTFHCQLFQICLLYLFFLLLSVTLLFQLILFPSTHHCHLSCTLSTNQILDVSTEGCMSEGEEEGCHDPVDSFNMCCKKTRAAQLKLDQKDGHGFPTQQDTTDTCHPSRVEEVEMMQELPVLYLGWVPEILYK